MGYQNQLDLRKNCVPDKRATPVKNSYLFECRNSSHCEFKAFFDSKTPPLCNQSLPSGKYHGRR